LLVDPRPLVDFALLQSMTRTEPPLSRLALLGFRAPTAFQAPGSDLHRAYLTRLCCVSRLSQPPDAFIPPGTARPCFVPMTLLGFPLQRFPLPAAGVPLSRSLPLVAFGHLSVAGEWHVRQVTGGSTGLSGLRQSSRVYPVRSPNHLQGFALGRKSVHRTPGDYTMASEPFLSWVFSPPGFSPRLPWPATAAPPPLYFGAGMLPTRAPVLRSF